MSIFHAGLSVPKKVFCIIKFTVVAVIRCSSCIKGGGLLLSKEVAEVVDQKYQVSKYQSIKVSKYRSIQVSKISSATD